MDWYLLKTKPRQESRAKLHLENQSFTTYLPLLTRKDGSREALFPGYIFLSQIVAEEAPPMAVIRSTRGVNGFVRFGHEFALAPDSLIEGLQGLESQYQNIPRFRAGQQVEFKSGPFEGLRGIFQCENSQERCVVLLTILNRTQAIFASQQQLRATN